VKFLPSSHSTAAGHFDVESSQDGSTVAAQSGQATSTITVTPSNDPPDGIVLSSDSILENTDTSSAVLVGTFATSDPNVGDSHTYTLVAGIGDTDNGVFLIADSQLQVRAGTVLDSDTQDSYGIRVATTDAAGLKFEQTFTISVTNLNEAPVLASIGSKSVNEGSLLTFTASASDPDVPANALTYSLDAGAPVGASIDATSGVFTWTPSEAQGPGTFNVTVRVTDDGTPNLDDFETIEVRVGEVNDVAPQVSDNTFRVDENSQAATVVGQVQASDEDSPSDLTYEIVTAEPSNPFAINVFSAGHV
jgi:hypothetical protein